MRGRREWEQCGGWPAKEKSDRVREQGSDPAEVPFYVAIAVELGVTLGGECAGKENSEKEKDDSADLAREGRLRRSIVPVPARAS